MPATKEGFQFTDDDAMLVQHIHECRLATVDHLAALTERRPKDVHRRLFRLASRHYLQVINRRPQKSVYAIGKEGISVLVERGVAPRELLEWRLRHAELKDLFLDHELLITDVYTRLTAASRTSHLKLITWRQDRGLWDFAPVVEDGERNMLPVRPDAYFVLEDSERPQGKNHRSFFLEADRSTTTHRRFQLKLLAYWSYLQNGLHTKKLGLTGSFYVVTVTLTDERAAGLCAAAREVLPDEADKFFLFTSLPKIPLHTPAPIMGDVFLSPRDYDEGRRYPLIRRAAQPLTATDGAG